jgi:hypothetical protein
LFVFRSLVGSLRLRGAVLLLVTGLLAVIALAAFSSFFLLELPPPAGSTSGGEGELIAYLDGAIATVDVERLYTELRNDARVSGVSFLLPQELSRRDVSGALIVQATASFDALLGELEGNDAVVRVDRTATSSGALGTLPPSLRWAFSLCWGLWR